MPPKAQTVREEIQELREEVRALRAAVRKHAKVLDLGLGQAAPRAEHEPYRYAPAPQIPPATGPGRARKNLHVRFAD